MNSRTRLKREKIKVQKIAQEKISQIDIQSHHMDRDGIIVVKFPSKGVPASTLKNFTRALQKRIKHIIDVPIIFLPKEIIFKVGKVDYYIRILESSLTELKRWKSELEGSEKSEDRNN